MAPIRAASRSLRKTGRDWFRRPCRWACRLACCSAGLAVRLPFEQATAAGIADPAERARRRESDHRLAEELENSPFEDFIECWQTQLLFADDPAEVGARAREDQRRNRPDALAAVLRGIGTGEMEPLWDRLGELTMPVTVIVGDRDAKFHALGQRMTALLPHADLVVLQGGHRLPLENPAALAKALASRKAEASSR